MHPKHTCIGTAFMASIITLAAHAQQPWQKLQMPTAAEVQRTWTAPPPEYGPEPYYGLNGPVDQTVIERDLDVMKALGYTAVTAQAGYGMNEPYLSEAYFKLFRILVEQAKKRNMRVWIVDDAGYPSGFAGGKFSELKPALRMQALVIAEHLPTTGGDLITHALKPETVAVTAINQVDGSTIAIPITNAAIAWKAPPGKWTVVIVEHQFSTSPTRSDTNPKRVKDGTQSLEDYLDPAATAQYLEFTHEQYKKYLGDEFGKTIMGFRGDEPDYSIRGLPWTPKFFDRFQQVKGYDIRPYVATFIAPSPSLTDPQRRAKADYDDVFSQMFRDGFFKPQGDWCAANHLEYQVHLNHEEMELQLAHSEGDFFRAMRFVQVPGIDSIWHQIFPDTISDFPRLASSVSHVYGKPRAFTESFAAYRPEPNITDARYVINEQFVRGINLVETMYYPSSATPGGHGPSPYMRDPTYPQLLTYTRRMSYLLSMGQPTAAVALYLPTSSLWLNDEASDTAFVAAEQLLSEHQIDFDIVGDDAIATDLKAPRGAFETLSGNSYRTVIIPSAAVISQTALDRLQAFASGGGRVLFLGRTPTLISGKTIVNARAATAADFAWAEVEISAQLPPTPTPPAQPPTSPPAPQVVPPAILKAVTVAVGSRDITLDAPDTSLRYMKRRLKDSDVYLFFNEGATTDTHAITFHTDAQMIEVWDPETGSVSSAISTRGEGTMTIQLAMKPYATIVLMAR
jgi:hypothetical protein